MINSHRSVSPGSRDHTEIFIDPFVFIFAFILYCLWDGKIFVCNRCSCHPFHITPSTRASPEDIYLLHLKCGKTKSSVLICWWWPLPNLTIGVTPGAGRKRPGGASAPVLGPKPWSPLSFEPWLHPYDRQKDGRTRHRSTYAYALHVSLTQRSQFEFHGCQMMTRRPRYQHALFSVRGRNWLIEGGRLKTHGAAAAPSSTTPPSPP